MQIQDLLRARVALPYTDLHSDGLLVRVPPDREHDVRVSYVAAGASDARPRRMQALVERLVQRGYVVHSASDVNDPTLVMRWEHVLRMPNYAFSVKPLDYRHAIERVVSVEEVLEAFAWGSTCPCCGSSDGLTVWDDENAVVRWRCPSAAQTGGIVELVRLLDSELDDEQACLLLLEQLELLPQTMIEKMLVQPSEKLLAQLSEEETRLRSQLWFPELIDQLIEQAQGVLKEGRTLTTKRRIDGFLRPVVALQETSVDNPELLRFALAETIRHKVCTKARGDKWAHYPKRIMAAAGTETRAQRQADEMLAAYGLSLQTVSLFGLRADVGAQRLAIPLREDGELVGHDLRALCSKAACTECGEEVSAKQMSDLMSEDMSNRGFCPNCGQPGLAWLQRQHPTYRCRAEAGFERRRFVYNLDQARAELEQPDAQALYVVDGYSDCWVAVEGGYRSTVSINGMMWPEKAAKVAAAAAAAGKPVVLVPDFDKSGIANAERSIQMLLEADPSLDVRVADQCLNFWGKDAPVATDIGQAATRIGVRRATAPLKFTSHWAVFLTRLIVDIDDPTSNASQLNHQKSRIGQVLGKITGEHAKSAYAAIRQILEVAWEPLMPAASVDAWVAFTVANATAEIDEKTLAGSDVASWIDEHGSKVLKHGMRRGYDIAELYARERAAVEFGAGAQVLAAGTGAAKGLKKRNHPSEAELARELAVIETGVVDERQVRIVYVEQWSQSGVAIHDWAGRFTVLLQIHDN